jgi:hypothetical protein
MTDLAKFAEIGLILMQVTLIIGKFFEKTKLKILRLKKEYYATFIGFAALL